MRIEVKIVDDDGTILSEHKADASQPSMWRAPQGSRFVSDMPRQSENPATGTYELFGITFQPHVRVDRPNGYVAPVPQPFPTNGNSLNFPQQAPAQSFGIPKSISDPVGSLKG